MSELISILKDEHQKIKDLLSNVYEYVGSESKKIDFVNQLDNLVTEHLRKEENELYPFLKEEAKEDNSLKNKMDAFLNNREEIKSFTLYYIDKYSKGNFDDKFSGDTAKLLSSLRQCMIKEEVSIYSEYLNRKLQGIV
jgi:hemerythrin-like domain-containing protein